MAMEGAPLKSFDFRRERENGWRELDALVNRVQSRGIARLDASELRRLPMLYRAALSSLSVARSISLDRNVVDYLESLCLRAYFCVYGGRVGLLAGLRHFLLRGLPSAVYALRWYVAIAAGILVLGGVVGFAVTAGNLDWYFAFVPRELAGERTPTTDAQTLQALLYRNSDAAAEKLNLFASFLFTHNARIGLLCFALGFALGIPAAFLLFKNGLTLGAFIALYAERGLQTELTAWLFVHGTTELLAVVLCGGAGLAIGSALAFPGQYSRMHNLRVQGRLAATVVMGAVILFFVAALLEGFGRQLITDVALRYLVGGSALVFWLLYLFSPRDAGDDLR